MRMSIATVTDYVGGWVQIDENSGGLATQPYYADFAYTNDPRSNGVLSWISIPTSVYRIYYKPEGTYTFRLEGAKFVNCGPGFVVIVSDCMLRATYYPSSYGSVTTLVSATEAGQFDKAEAVSVPTGIDGKGPATTMYQVDLRELELKAAKAHAAALQADMELMRAKMEEQSKQATDGKAR